MKINYDDLVAYLDQSEDWHQVEAESDRLLYNGPDDAYGEPVEIVLPSDTHFSDLQPLMEMAVNLLAALQGCSFNAMADIITPSSVGALMDAIKWFDCEPPIYNVTLRASSHRSGFEAYARFRSTPPCTPSELSAHGDSPEETLTRLLAVLKAKWGRCPHCGQQHLSDVKENAIS